MDLRCRIGWHAPEQYSVRFLWDPDEPVLTDMCGRCGIVIVPRDSSAKGSA